MTAMIMIQVIDVNDIHQPRASAQGGYLWLLYEAGSYLIQLNSSTNCGPGRKSIGKGMGLTQSQLQTGFVYLDR